MSLEYEMGPDGCAYYKGLRIQAFADVHVYVAKRIRDLYPSGGRILDLASGTGSLAQRLIDYGFEVHCTTWNNKLRVEAPTYHLDLDNPFRCSDVGGVPFDVIVASEIIEHIENPSVLLRSCAAALTSGGLLLVTTPNIGYVLSRLQSLKRGYPQVFARDEVVRNRHISMIWPIGFRHLAETAGLRVDEERYMGSLALPMPKRAILKLLARMMGPTSAGASCVFSLSKSSATPRDAAVTR